MRASRASVSTSGVEREPGDVHASRSPQRTSSSTNARRPMKVSVPGMMWRVPPALVLLHGFTQTRQSWRRTVRALGAPGYRALVPDLPGHGQAAQRTPSFDACTAYVRALAPERFTLAGYSMGGRIALHAALALRTGRAPRPGRRQPGPRGRRRARGPRAPPTTRWPTASRQIGVEAFAAEWGAQPLFAGQPERVAAAANADRLRNTAARPRRRAARPRHGRHGAAVGPARRAGRCP